MHKVSLLSRFKKQRGRHYLHFFKEQVGYWRNQDPDSMMLREPNSKVASQAFVLSSSSPTLCMRVQQARAHQNLYGQKLDLHSKNPVKISIDVLLGTSYVTPAEATWRRRVCTLQSWSQHQFRPFHACMAFGLQQHRPFRLGCTCISTFLGLNKRTWMCFGRVVRDAEIVYTRDMYVE